MDGGGIHLKMKAPVPGRFSNVLTSARSSGSVTVGAAKAHAGAAVDDGPTGAGGDVFVTVGRTTTTARVAVRVAVFTTTSGVIVANGVTVAGSGVVVTGTKTIYGVWVATRVGWALAVFEPHAEAITTKIPSATRKTKLVNLTDSP